MTGINTCSEESEQSSEAKSIPEGAASKWKTACNKQEGDDNGHTGILQDDSTSGLNGGIHLSDSKYLCTADEFYSGGRVQSGGARGDESMTHVVIDCQNSCIVLGNNSQSALSTQLPQCKHEARGSQAPATNPKPTTAFNLQPNTTFCNSHGENNAKSSQAGKPSQAVNPSQIAKYNGPEQHPGCQAKDLNNKQQYQKSENILKFSSADSDSVCSIKIPEPLEKRREHLSCVRSDGDGAGSEAASILKVDGEAVSFEGTALSTVSCTQPVCICTQPLQPRKTERHKSYAAVLQGNTEVKSHLGGCNNTTWSS